MRALTLTLLRELSTERFVSGAALAAKYGISRSAVSDAFKEASDLGVHLFSLTRRGYRLAEPIELLDRDAILAHAGGAKSRVSIEIVETIDSTNTQLLARSSRERADILPLGRVLVAELQTAGRGRRGRTWQSALGASLTFSYLLRTEKGAQDLAGLSLAVGVAIAEALRANGVPAQVKWPNDILLDDAKLGGILVETHGDVLGPTSVVIGVGLNIKLTDSAKANIDQRAVDVAAANSEIGRNALFGKVLQALVAVLDVFAQSGFPALRDRWRALHAWQGRIVEVGAPNEQYAARVVDVAEDGALIVERSGAKHRLTSADISVKANAK
jgi:BirA family transcriptional regulator, biotin operon repressor / biotin---[acetyl-CoA-carboxylase] ligase